MRGCAGRLHVRVSDQAPPLDALVDRLFDEKPDGFVTARNDLAKALRRSGRKAEADQVKKLSKPNIAVWLANQWARKHPALMHHLLSAVDVLRSLQTCGEDAPDHRTAQARLAEARAEERRVLEALEAAGMEILAAAGTKASAAIVARSLKTARAAAAHPDRRAVLKSGRLQDEVENSGFAGLADAMPAVDLSALRARRRAAEAPATPPERPRPFAPVNLDTLRNRTRHEAPKSADAPQASNLVDHPEAPDDPQGNLSAARPRTTAEKHAIAIRPALEDQVVESPPDSEILAQREKIARLSRAAEEQFERVAALTIAADQAQAARDAADRRLQRARDEQTTAENQLSEARAQLSAARLTLDALTRSD